MMPHHPHFLRCFAANIMHVYIVDSLLGSMFTNGSGRTADVLYARGSESPMHFAHKHAPAWTSKDHLQAYNYGKVYNTDVSGIINKVIRGK